MPLHRSSCMKRPFTGMTRVLAAAVVLLSAVTARPYSAHAASRGYTVTWSSRGAEISVHFDRRSFPARALIAATATIRNVSDPHLLVSPAQYPYGLCSWPAVSILSVDAAGRDVAPQPPIPRPMPDCAFMPGRPLPVGESVLERLYVVLWTSRLKLTADLTDYAHGCYCGFTANGPTVRFTLHRAPAPKIIVRNDSRPLEATVRPPPGARGPLYIEGWGTCPRSSPMQPYSPTAFPGMATTYWTPQTRRVFRSACPQPAQWHLDAAWLNMPVATLNYGVPPNQHG